MSVKGKFYQKLNITKALMGLNDTPNNCLNITFGRPGS